MKRQIWTRWLRALNPISTRKTKAQNRDRKQRVTLETLEDRLAPAAFTWVGQGASGAWSLPANWQNTTPGSPDLVPQGNPVSPDSLTFPDLPTGRQFATTNDLMFNGNPLAISQIQITGEESTAIPGTGADYTLGGNNITLTGTGLVGVAAGLGVGALAPRINLNMTLGTANFTVNQGSELLVNGSLSGPGNSVLNKNSLGILTLAGDNSGLLGRIAVSDNSGILRASHANALGDFQVGGIAGGNFSKATTIGFQSTLQVSSATGITLQEELLLRDSGGASSFGALYNLVGNNVLTGNILMDGPVNGAVRMGAEAGTSMELAGRIDQSVDPLGLGKIGPGEIILNPPANPAVNGGAGGNTYNGLTQVSDGTLTIRHPFALGKQGTAGNGTVVSSDNVGQGTLRIDHATGIIVRDELLTLNGRGFNQQGALQNSRGNNEWAAGVTLGNFSSNPFQHEVWISSELDNGVQTDLLISGIVSGGPVLRPAQVPPATDPYSLTKIGPGRLIFNNANTYQGTTTITTGTLTIRDSNGLGAGGPTAGTTVLNGAALEYEIEDGANNGANPGTDPHGRNLGIDSVTGNAIGLIVTEAVTINGRGFNDTGALRSRSGINVHASTLILGSSTLNNGGFRVTVAAVGVDPDPTPLTDSTYFTNDYSLTISALIVGDNPTSLADADRWSGTDFAKRGTGHLILTAANTYTGHTFIEEGWVTVQNAQALGSKIPQTGLIGKSDTAQPGTTVFAGAALHLKSPTPSGSLTLDENLILQGDGVTGSFAVIANSLPVRGALVSIGGTNLLTGTVQLLGSAGISVEEVEAGNTSQLTTRGKIDDYRYLNINAAGTASQQYSRIIDTRVPTGNIDLRAYVRVVTGLSGAVFSIRDVATGTVLFAGPTWSFDQVDLNRIFNLGAASKLEFRVVPGTAPWEFSATIEVNAGAGGIKKYGSKRLIMQGEGSYTGDFDILEGVVQIQHDTALGDDAGKTTVAAGAALELNTSIATTSGGIVAGLQTWGEQLVLNGDGNTTNGGPIRPLTVISGGDHMWRGRLTLGSLTTLDVQANSRLSLFGVIDDTATGLDLTKIGAGELVLGGANTYRGVTNVNEGIVTVVNNLGLGSTLGGTVVALGATLQLQGGLTIADEALTLQGTGVATVPNTAGLRWFNTGPAPITNGQTTGTNVATSGRVTSIAADPSDPKVYYIATSGGGAWKTKDGGQTWQPLFDFQTSPTILSHVMRGGSIAVAPSDPRTIYFATGEFNNAADSFAGSGVYKTTDGGQTWNLVTSSSLANPLNRLAVTKIIVDPLNANRFFASTSDQANNALSVPLSTTTGVGVYRYDGTDYFNMTGGVTLARGGAVPGPDDASFVRYDVNQTWSDIVLIHRGGANYTLFAALGTPQGDTTHNANPSAGNAPGLGANANTLNTVYRSDDPFSATAYGFDAETVVGVRTRFSDATRHSNGMIKLTYAPGAGHLPSTLTNLSTYNIYAVISFPTPVGGTNRPGEIFDVQKTSNPTAGSIWGIASTGAALQSVFGTIPNARGDYSTVIQAAPDQASNGNTVYLGGFGKVLVSIDGATNWTDITTGSGSGAGTGLHINQHAMTFDANNQLLLGNDGGIWRLENPTVGQINWGSLNADLSITSLNSIATHPTDPERAQAGAQNNGNIVWTGTDQGWQTNDTDEGGQVRIDPRNPQVVWHIQSPNNVSGTAILRRSTNGGATWTNVLAGLTRFAPVYLDPDTTQRLLVGGTTLRETLDNGTSFTDLVPGINVTLIGAATFQGAYNITGFSGPTGPTDPLRDKGVNGFDKDTVYVGNATTVRLTKNHGTTWVTRTPNVVGFTGSFSDILVDPRQRDTVYVSRSAYGAAGALKVAVSINAGVSWTDLSNGLPDVPVWSLEIDPRTGTVYAGTEVGVYSLAQGATTWQAFNLGMPRVQVRDLELNQRLNTLSAATLGRGMYQIFLPDILPNSGALRAVSGENKWTGSVTLAGPTTIYAGGTQALQGLLATASLEISGVIDDATGVIDPTLTKDGPGDVIFSGANLYGGLTDITEGVLIVTNASALGQSDAPGKTIVQNGAALHLRSTDLTGESIDLFGDGIDFQGRKSGAIRSVSGANTITGVLTLKTNSTIGVDGGSTLTVVAPTGSPVSITDEGNNFSLSKELTGTLVLASANDHGGKTFVNQGELRVTDSGALGDSGMAANGTDVLNGAQLELQGGITVTDETLQLSGLGVSSGGIDQGALESTGGVNTWTGPVILTSLPLPGGPATVKVGATSGSDLVITGVVSEMINAPAPPDDYNLWKVGLGRVILTNDNTYEGLTTVETGTLNIRHAGALGTFGSATNGTVVLSGATLEVESIPAPGVVNAEFLTLNGDGVGGGGALRNVAGDNTWSGPITLASSSSIGADTVAGVDTELTITGSIAGTVLESLTKVGTGTVILPDDKTYLGFTFVNAGVLNIQHAGALGDGTAGTAVASGATLQLENLAAAVTTETLTLNGAGYKGMGALENLDGANRWSSPITLASDSSIGVTSTGSEKLTIDAVISETGGNFGLTKVGPGTLQFDGAAANTYTGLTQVNAGTLELNKTAGTVSLNGNLTIGNWLPGVGADPDLTAASVLWMASNQVVDSSIVTVNRDGTLDLAGLAETITQLKVQDGLAKTGNGGTLTASGATALDMAGGTVDTGTGGTLALNGNVVGSSSALGSAVIDGATGTVALGATVRDFTISDGPSAAPVDLRINDPIIGAGIRKLGTGRLELDVDGDFTTNGTTPAPVEIVAGAVQVDGTVGDVQLTGTGRLEGGSTAVSVVNNVGAITGASGGPAVGAVAPGAGPNSTGILNSTGNSVWGPQTDFVVDLVNTTLGTGHDQLRILNGNLDLGGAELVGLVNPAIPVGSSFTIIEITGAGLITNKFAQGDVVFIDGKKFDIEYTTDGKRVILHRVKASPVITLESNKGMDSGTGQPLPTVYGEYVNYAVTIGAETGSQPVPGDALVRFKFIDGSTGLTTFSPQIRVDSLGIGSGTLADPWRLTYDPSSSNGPGGPLQVTVNPPPLMSVPHQIEVEFVGTAFFDQTFEPAGFETPFLQVVNKAVPTMNVNTTPVVSATSPVFGETINVAVTLQSPVPQPPMLPPQPLGTRVTGTQPVTGFVLFVIDTNGNGVLDPDGVDEHLPLEMIDSSGIADIDLIGLARQSHRIFIKYVGENDGVEDGDVNYETNTTSLVIDVKKAEANIVIDAVPNFATGATLGETVTFFATFSPASPSPSTTDKPIGTADFYYRNGVVDVFFGTGTIDVNGVAQASIVPSTVGMDVGPHLITVVYTGDTNYNGKTQVSGTPYTVKPSTTTFATFVSSKPSNAVFGDMVTYTVDVDLVPPIGEPQGVVTFIVDGGAPQTRTVDANGVASITVRMDRAGVVPVMATFDDATGSPDRYQVFSQTLNQTVAQAGTTTSNVSPSLASSANGQPVTYSVRVTSNFPNAGAPVGTVRFFYQRVSGGPLTGKIAMGVAALGAVAGSPPSSIATLSNFILPGAGVYELTAEYLEASSPNFAGDASGPGAQTRVSVVANASVVTQVVSSKPISEHLERVSFTAVVRGGALNGPKNQVPTTGTVTFFINGAALVTLPVNANGVAIWRNVPLAVSAPGNPHDIQARYNGNPSFSTSPVTAAIAQTVNPARTKTVMTSNRNPAYLGQGVLVTATISTLAPGGGVPRGTVTFVVNGVVRAPVGVNIRGQAFLSLGIPPVGNYSIQAYYNASATHRRSAAGFTQLVRNATKLTAVAPAAVGVGQLFNLFGTARGADNSVVPGFVGTGTIEVYSIAPSGAVSAANGALAGPRTARFVNGTATFASMRFVTTGRFLIRVRAAGTGLFTDIIINVAQGGRGA